MKYRNFPGRSDQRMSTIKKKLQQAASGYDAGLQSDQESNDGGSDTEMAPKYMLRVSAGPSYDPSTHRLLVVNSSDALSFENEFVRVKVKVRIRDYVGLPKDSPKHTPYFDDPIHKHDQYSVAFSFVPKVDLPSTDTVWGNDFDHPVRDRLPPGFNTAFKIVKEFIDPGLSCDAYADQPWLYGPALSCWFAFRIGEKVPETDNIQQPDEEQVMTDGADGSGADIRKELDLPEAGDKRRKFFLSQENREQLVFEKGRLYQGDFFNPYLDFNSKSFVSHMLSGLTACRICFAITWILSFGHPLH